MAEHAGYSNAYTGEEETNFYFVTDTSDLRTGLDMLAHFFVNPTLRRVYTELGTVALLAGHRTLLTGHRILLTGRTEPAPSPSRR